jgi:hypothetical protein
VDEEITYQEKQRFNEMLDQVQKGIEEQLQLDTGSNSLPMLLLSRFPS